MGGIRGLREPWRVSQHVGVILALSRQVARLDRVAVKRDDRGEERVEAVKVLLCHRHVRAVLHLTVSLRRRWSLQALSRPIGSRCLG